MKKPRCQHCGRTRDLIETIGNTYVGKTGHVCPECFRKQIVAHQIGPTPTPAPMTIGPGTLSADGKRFYAEEDE